MGSRSSPLPRTSAAQHFLMVIFPADLPGRAISTMTPSCRRATVSHNAAASSMLWVVRKTAHPEFFFSRMILWIDFMVRGSRPPVDSSRKMIRGACRKARALKPGPHALRQALGRLFRRVTQANLLQSGLYGAMGDAVDIREYPQIIKAGEPLIYAEPVHHDPDLLLSPPVRAGTLFTGRRRRPHKKAARSIS